jgi:hypothetical protein
MITSTRCSQITRLLTSAIKILPHNSTTQIISKWDLVSAWAHQVTSQQILEVEVALPRGTVITDTFQGGIMGQLGLSNSSLMILLIPSRCSIVPKGRLSITIKGLTRMVLTTQNALAVVSMLP